MSVDVIFKRNDLFYLWLNLTHFKKSIHKKSFQHNMTIVQLYGTDFKFLNK